MDGKLILEDGTIFEGNFYGYSKDTCGPIILNTAVVGYQELMTDPVNAGKILVLTYPLIGNYGINEKFNSSPKGRVNGLIIKEASYISSNFQAESSLDQFLNKEQISCLNDIDTRTLAVKIRDDGEMWGLITVKDTSKEKGLETIKTEKTKNPDYISKLSVKEITNIYTPAKNSKGKMVIIDLGITKNIIEQVKKLDFEIFLAPYNISSEDILSLNPTGIIISNGPEEDISHIEVVNTVKKILGKVPMLGISLGHLIISLALDGKIQKMKSGHRGVNYPVISPNSFKGEITVQNHGFIVDEKSMPINDIKIEEINLNDKSIEKMKSEKYKFISTQYIPSSPGFDEVNNIFYEFSDLLLKKGEFVHA